MLMLCDCTHLQELKCTFVSNVIKFRVFTKNVGYSISESFVKEKKIKQRNDSFNVNKISIFFTKSEKFI